MNMKQNDQKGPGVKFPPPLVFVTGLALGWLVQRLLPVEFAYSPLLYGAGVVLVLSGLLLVAVAALQFRRSKTHIEPWKPTSSIMTSGVFAWSRNPVYVAFCLVALGLGAVAHNFWMMLSFVPSAWVVYRMAILKEERYLEEKFGAEYLAYKQKVRRWL